MTLTIGDAFSEAMAAVGPQGLLVASHVVLVASHVVRTPNDGVQVRSTPAIEDLWTSTFNLRWGKHLHDPVAFSARRAVAVASLAPLESGRRRRPRQPE
jgi:hypothetical protein